MLDRPTLQNVLFELGALPVAEPGTLTMVAKTAIQPSSKPATQEQPHARGRSCHLDVEKEARCRLPPGQLSKCRDLLQVGVRQQPWDHYPEGSAGRGGGGWCGVRAGERSKHKDKIHTNSACKSWDANYHLTQSPRNHKRKRLTYRCPEAGMRLRRNPKLS